MPIPKVKDKVLHIVTANISKIVIDVANSTAAFEYEVVYRLSTSSKFRFDLGSF